MTLDLYINEANDYARDIRVPVLHPLRQDRKILRNEPEIGFCIIRESPKYPQKKLPYTLYVGIFRIFALVKE